jgi:hypothetical protein
MSLKNMFLDENRPQLANKLKWNISRVEAREWGELVEGQKARMSTGCSLYHSYNVLKMIWISMFKHSQEQFVKLSILGMSKKFTRFHLDISESWSISKAWTQDNIKTYFSMFFVPNGTNYNRNLTSDENASSHNLYKWCLCAGKANVMVFNCCFSNIVVNHI